MKLVIHQRNLLDNLVFGQFFRVLFFAREQIIGDFSWVSTLGFHTHSICCIKQITHKRKGLGKESNERLQLITILTCLII